MIIERITTDDVGERRSEVFNKGIKARKKEREERKKKENK